MGHGTLGSGERAVQNRGAYMRGTAVRRAEAGAPRVLPLGQGRTGRTRHQRRTGPVTAALGLELAAGQSGRYPAIAGWAACRDQEQEAGGPSLPLIPASLCPDAQRALHRSIAGREVGHVSSLPPPFPAGALDFVRGGHPRPHRPSHALPRSLGESPPSAASLLVSLVCLVRQNFQELKVLKSFPALLVGVGVSCGESREI